MWFAQQAGREVYVLTSYEIDRLIAEGGVGWSGELRGDALMLRLGAPMQAFAATGIDVVDLADQPSIDRLYEAPIDEWDTFDLDPGRMVLCRVNHPLRLGPGYAGAIGGLSHLARAGLRHPHHEPMGASRMGGASDP